MMQLEPLQHQVLAVAQQIHAVLALAYAQEAQLLGLSNFPPLQRTVADLQLDGDVYLGARLGSNLGSNLGGNSGSHAGDPLVGAVAFGPDPEGGQLLVSVLVVAPAAQRQGVARALMKQLLSLAGPWPVAVATAQANRPAVLLYESLGFVAYRQGSVGPDALPIVKLRHVSRAEHAPAQAPAQAPK